LGLLQETPWSIGSSLNLAGDGAATRINWCPFQCAISVFPPAPPTAKLH
jgi:hypothetical protein